MSKPLEEHYDFDRSALPKEFTGKGYTYKVYLSGTRLGYRSKDAGALGVLSPREFPVRKVIDIYDENGFITRYTEQLEENLEFDADHIWIDLGVGVMPKVRTGTKRILFDAALGYLSGFPTRDIFNFIKTMTLSKARQNKIINRELKDPLRDAHLARMEEKIKIANPYYDERDS